MAGEECQVDEGQRGGCPVRELRDAHAPVDRPVLCRGIQAGRPANILGGDTR